MRGFLFSSKTRKSANALAKDAAVAELRDSVCDADRRQFEGKVMPRNNSEDHARSSRRHCRKICADKKNSLEF